MQEPKSSRCQRHVFSEDGQEKRRWGVEVTLAQDPSLQGLWASLPSLSVLTALPAPRSLSVILVMAPALINRPNALKIFISVFS